MAWYRAGGGGIPSSLKTGMNNVLNKKFGTSTTYAPATWPDNVNLLGPLPEKTVSGSVASFSDGADDVPIKSASFGILASGGGGTPSAPVSIVGVSSVGVVHCGANIWDEQWETGTYDATTGQPGYSSSRIRSKVGNDIFVKGLTSLYVVAPENVRCIFLDDNGNVLGSPSAVRNDTVTITTGAVWCRFYTASTYGGTYNNDISINSPNTATSYNAYHAETVTIQLGQTVYGGTLSENGTLTIDFAYTEFKDLTWQKHSTAQNTYFADVPTAKTGSASTKVNAICSAYQVVTRNNKTGQPINYSISASNVNGGRFFVLDDSYTTLEDFQEATKNYQLAYELATPIVVTGLDEISLSTYLGDNNIWCDTGDSEIVYRADIALALGGGS